MDIDRVKAMQLCSMEDVFQTLQVQLASYYVNNWNKYGQVYDVDLQAEGSTATRSRTFWPCGCPAVRRHHSPRGVRHLGGGLGPLNIQHYNMYESVRSSAGPPRATPAARRCAMMEAAKQVLEPAGLGYEWTGTVYQQLKAGKATIFIYAFSLIIVFLVLSALYESWTMPFIILLSVPLAVLGAVLGALRSAESRSTSTVRSGC